MLFPWTLQCTGLSLMLNGGLQFSLSVFFYLMKACFSDFHVDPSVPCDPRIFYVQVGGNTPFFRFCTWRPFMHFLFRVCLMFVAVWVLWIKYWGTMTSTPRCAPPKNAVAGTVLLSGWLTSTHSTFLIAFLQLSDVSSLVPSRHLWNESNQSYFVGCNSNSLFKHDVGTQTQGSLAYSVFKPILQSYSLQLSIPFHRWSCEERWH